jgi:hypothetical protein
MLDSRKRLRSRLASAKTRSAGQALGPRAGKGRSSLGKSQAWKSLVTWRIVKVAFSSPDSHEP